jgi:hypothetical protein
MRFDFLPEFFQKIHKAVARRRASVVWPAIRLPCSTSAVALTSSELGTVRRRALFHIGVLRPVMIGIHHLIPASDVTGIGESP